MENVLWKKVRKSEEDQYDFSSADIGKMQTGTTQRKSKGSKSRTLPSIPGVPETSDPVLHSLNPEIQAPETTDHGLDLQNEDLIMVSTYIPQEHITSSMCI